VAPSDNSPLGGHPIAEANMFGTLLESRARRRRRPGGAAVSVAVHMAIIGVITATAVHGDPVSKERPDPILLRFKSPPPPAPRPIDHTTRDVLPGTVIRSPITFRDIPLPTTISDHLPPIDSSFGRGIDSIVIGQGGSSPGLAHALGDGGDRNGPSEWVGADLQTRILASGRPRYPESLRQAAIDGRVLVRFTVDTTGRIEMNSVTVLASTHDLFTRAVRDALPAFLFKPAEQGGHHVRALAEMPFEFQITK
jgi:TonB family protein